MTSKLPKKNVWRLFAEAQWHWTPWHEVAIAIRLDLHTFEPSWCVPGYPSRRSFRNMKNGSTLVDSRSSYSKNNPDGSSRSLSRSKTPIPDC